MYRLTESELVSGLYVSGLYYVESLVIYHQTFTEQIDRISADQTTSWVPKMRPEEYKLNKVNAYTEQLDLR